MMIKAAAVTLRQHPIINSSWQDDQIAVNGNINIGVAVAVDEGLLVPVIRNADYKSLDQIRSEIVEMAGRAREGKMQPEEMQGNQLRTHNRGRVEVEECT